MLRVLLSLALFAVAEGLHPLMALHAERATQPLTAPIAAPLRAARCIPGSFRLAEDPAASDAAAAETNAEVVDEATEAAAEEDAVDPTPEDTEAEVTIKKPEAKKEEEDDLLSSPAFLKQKVKVLEKDLMEVQDKVTELKAAEIAASEEWREKRERLDNDFANYKARHYNETLSKQNEAKVELIKQFLPLLDNLDRAKAASKTEGDVQVALNDRYLALCALLLTKLEEMGLERMEVVGKEFDYNLHQAIQQVPSDEYDENVVCSELQPGYTCGDKLVRAAYVIVASG